MLSVAFEGCACRAAFHVGVATWWTRRGMRPEVVAGASSGALVAAAVAVGRTDELREVWLEMAGTRVFEPRRLLRGRWPGRMSHLLGDRLRVEHGDLRMRDVPALRVVITRVGLRGLRSVVLRGGSERVVDAVLGSCFIPGPYSRPVVLQGRPAVDGAWFARTPIDALPRGRRIAVVTNTQGRLFTGWPRQRVERVPKDVRVLAPIEELPLTGFDFDGPGTRAAIAIGEASAAAFHAEHWRWIQGGEAFRS